MTIKKLLCFIGAAAMVVGVAGGCASSGDSGAAKSAAAMSDPMAGKAQAAIDEAKAAQKAAASVGGEWRDTGKTIKKAEAALKEGKFADAIKLANKAKFEGEAGKKQAEEQKNATIPDYVYK